MNLDLSNTACASLEVRGDRSLSGDSRLSHDQGHGQPHLGEEPQSVRPTVGLRGKRTYPPGEDRRHV